MRFSAEELAYLGSGGLARVATVAPDGQPDVVPVALEVGGDALWVGGVGEQVLRTRKMRNVSSGARSVAVVVDDLPSFDPFVARGIRIYGEAEPPVERVGMMGPGWYVRITPSTSWTWNLAGEPLEGAAWYATTRTDHR